jgi:hypothetical protein
MPLFNVGFHYAEGMYLTINAKDEDEASYIANEILQEYSGSIEEIHSMKHIENYKCVHRESMITDIELRK